MGSEWRCRSINAARAGLASIRNVTFSQGRPRWHRGFSSHLRPAGSPHADCCVSAQVNQKQGPAGCQRRAPFLVSAYRCLICVCVLCLQTHRELDGPADPQGRGHGAVHRPAETVSVPDATPSRLTLRGDDRKLRWNRSLAQAEL